MINLLFVHPDDKFYGLYSGKLSQHFKVHSAIDGLSAVRKVREINPRVVVSDYNLPYLSGKALIKFVRSYPPTAQSPFIFLSKNIFNPDALNLGGSAWFVASQTSPEIIIEQIYYLLKINKRFESTN